MTTQQLQDNRKRLGQIVAERREEKGLTQQQVADAAEMQRAHVARVEGGNYNVGVDILARIASALDCEIDFRDKSGPKK